MNEALQKELAAWMTDLRTNAEGIKDFALDQAPQVVHDFIALGRAESLSWAVGLPIAAILVALVIKRTWRILQDDKVDDFTGMSMLMAVLVLCIAEAAAVVGFLTNVHVLLSSWFAPRVYVIETLAAMAKAIAK